MGSNFKIILFIFFLKSCFLGYSQDLLLTSIKEKQEVYNDSILSLPDSCLKLTYSTYQLSRLDECRGKIFKKRAIRKRLQELTEGKELFIVEWIYPFKEKLGGRLWGEGGDITYDYEYLRNRGKLKVIKNNDDSDSAKKYSIVSKKAEEVIERWNKIEIVEEGLNPGSTRRYLIWGTRIYNKNGTVNVDVVLMLDF